MGMNNMDMNNTGHMDIRIRDHNTYLPKNDDRGDKIWVAFFVYILHY